MFRTKVAIALFAVFAVITGVLYFRLDDHVGTMARTRIDRELRLAVGALECMRRLQDYSIVDKASEIAAWPQLGEILARPREAFADAQGTPPTDDALRAAVHKLVQEEVVAWAARFEKLAEGRVKPEGTLADTRRERPGLFFVVDAEGIGIANGIERDWFGPQAADLKKEHPAFSRVLEEGKILQDIWIVKNAPLSVAAAPVRRDGRIVGAVVVGYKLEAEEARRDQRLVATEVAYFVGDRIQQSSTLNGALERELAQQFAAARTYQTVGGPPRGIEVNLGGRTYLGYLGSFESKASAQHAGFFVFGDLEAALADAHSVLMIVPVAGGFGFMLSLGLVLLFFRKQVAPFEDMDQGVLEIINGNLDYWFDVPGKDLAGTMSQNLNIMVCQLSGRPMPEDDDAQEGEHWAEDRMFIDEIDPSEFHARPVDSTTAEQNAFAVPGDAHSGMGYSPVILRLVRETDEVYRRRLFKEYTEALRGLGEPVQGISFDKFTAKLDANAQALKSKYGCQRVRFLVIVADRKVTLKPVPMN